MPRAASRGIATKSSWYDAARECIGATVRNTLLIETNKHGYYCASSAPSLALFRMPPVSPFQGGPETTRRRSQRVILSLPVIVRTEDGPKDSSFEEETNTLVVNVHGALILLAGKVVKGQRLRLTNRATKVEQLCRAATLGPTSGGKTQVGVEFLKPSPDFWHISFPPEDWVLPEPSSISSDDA